MNVRRLFRLSCLSVAGLFWASCGSDSSTQAVDSDVPESDPSADVSGGNSSAEMSETSSSSEQLSSEQESQSSAEFANSSAVEESSSSDAEISSSSEASNDKKYKLASDTSVTCEQTEYKTVSACPSSGTSYDCMDYKKFLATDTTVSEKILNAWEEKLEFCGAIREEVALYGIVAPVCAGVTFIPQYECSNGSSYSGGVVEEDLFYTSQSEYNEAHGVSSSSVAESSSSESEKMVQNCPREGFALFADVLAEVQKEIYEKLSNMLDVSDLALTDAQKQFYEGLLDRENKKLKGNLSPYYMDEYEHDVMYASLKRDSEHWFDGYIAKTYTCAGGTSVTNEHYQEKYDKILQECMDIINREAEQLD